MDESNYIDADNFYESAKEKYNIEDFNGAIIDIIYAIKLKPNYYWYFVFLGESKHKLKDYYGAIHAYSKAIDLNAEHDLAYSVRANSKVQLKDYMGAIEDYTKAIQINPYSNYSDYAYHAYYQRGSVKHKLGDKSGAYLDWVKAGEYGNTDAYELINKYFK